MVTRPSALALTVLFALPALGLLACGPSVPPPAAARPNLVLIVADALRRSNVSFLGYSRETTPHLDVLASEGYVFEQAIAVGGNTPTVMSALMTGRYPFFGFDEEWTGASFGMRRFYADSSEAGLPRNLATLAERLQAAGYTTAGFITNPYLKQEFDFHRGFDRYGEIFRDRGIPYGRGEEVSGAAIDFLRSRPTGRPFFVYLHYMDTHGPYWPPTPYRARFAVDGHEVTDLSAAWPRWEKQQYVDEADAAALAEGMSSLYDGAIAYVDDCIGQVVGALAETGSLGDTVIAFTADHGDEFLEHGGTTHKGTLYEELVRVPLMIRIPGRTGGRISDLVRNFDLTPTLLETAGVELSEQEMDAVSLLPLIDGKTASLRLTAYAGFPTIRMLRSPRYKLLHFRDGRRELYDLRGDPGERRNLYPGAAGSAPAASLEAVMARMVASLGAARPGEAAATPLDRETEEQLRALGYLN